MVWHIQKGQYSETVLDGLNILGLDSFTGNIWAGQTKATVAIFIDEKANEQQRHALQMIFGGKAGGFMAEFAKLIGEVRGLEFAPIKFEASDDLRNWGAEIPGKVVAKAEALSNLRLLLASEFRLSTHLAAKLVQERLQHGEKL